MKQRLSDCIYTILEHIATLPGAIVKGPEFPGTANMALNYTEKHLMEDIKIAEWSRYSIIAR